MSMKFDYREFARWISIFATTPIEPIVVFCSRSMEEPLQHLIHEAGVQDLITLYGVGGLSGETIHIGSESLAYMPLYRALEAAQKVELADLREDMVAEAMDRGEAYRQHFDAPDDKEAIADAVEAALAPSHG